MSYSQSYRYIKGRHAVVEALRAGLPVEQIIMVNSIRMDASIQEIVNLAQESSIRVLKISSKEFEQMVGESHTQHVVAKAAKLQIMQWKEAAPIIDQYPRIVICDHLEDPFNVGAIIRSCNVFGIDCVILPKRRAATISSGMMKASAGAIFHTQIVEVSSLFQAVKELQKKGYWIYSADHHASQSLTTFSSQDPFALVVGNEHKGVSKAIRKVVDQALFIPQKGDMESLNVSVATGIMLYQLTQEDLS